MPTPALVRTTCCIAGGGPAGMMLGFLLARAGIDAVVLERHADFLRDFRGDTIHPSTLEVMHELGLLDEFLARPHQEVREMRAFVGSTEVKIGDFSRLKTRCKFLAFMPQWDFLDFLAGHGRAYPGFHLRTRAEVTDLIRENDRIEGVRADTPDGPLEVRATLTIGADGRHSTVRTRAGLRVLDIGAPMDVLWMRLPRLPSDPTYPQGRFDSGRILIQLYRGDYWQCGIVIPKGGYEQIHDRGLDSLRHEIAAIAPLLADRVDALRDWDDVKLLTVAVDRLKCWHRPGLLCIGDAAHAMSPVGGVGINLAIQDAVAAANILAEPLSRGTLAEDNLAGVQRRREFPTRVTQKLQVLVQNRVIGRVLRTGTPLAPPRILRLLNRSPRLRKIPAYVVGVGIRPEHVRSPAVEPALRDVRV